MKTKEFNEKLKNKQLDEFNSSDLAAYVREIEQKATKQANTTKSFKPIQGNLRSGL